MYYQECVLKQYRALREQGLNVDVISMEHVLDGYKILAVPMAYLFCDGYEEKLRDYVKQGGTLVQRFFDTHILSRLFLTSIFPVKCFGC